MNAVIGVLCVVLAGAGQAGSRVEKGADDSPFRVVLVGTAGGPTLNPQRAGIGTLVAAGPELLLFDCGRGVPTAMVRMALKPVDLTGVFLTHLHSDHVIALPELYLYPWASQGRTVPFRVWGPAGTRAMMRHLQQAFAFDIHVRRDVDERLSAEGIRAIVTDIHEGVVFDSHGVKVTAFVVDHGAVKPAFGYRVDYQQHSLVLSGDTRPSDNLIKYASGADLLIHELGRSKQDPALVGPDDEWLPDHSQTRHHARMVAAHHTDPVEAGTVLQAARPKLAVFSHYNGAPASILSLVRQHYAGPVEFGEDGMTIDIGESVTVRRFVPGR
ncbi:MAG: MBL fold metallo-hydrolase [Acidobacteriota bacterium]